MKGKELFLMCLLFFFLTSCKEKYIDPLVTRLPVEKIDDPYAIRSDSIRKLVSRYAREKQANTCDSAIISYYEEGNDFLWITKYAQPGINKLMHYLGKVERHGISAGYFHFPFLSQEIAWLRTSPLRIHEKDEEQDINARLAKLEYLLSTGYIKYICGLQYGFLPLHKRKNKCDSYIPLQNYNYENCYDLLIRWAYQGKQTLEDAQPASSLYKEIQKQWMACDRQNKDTSNIRRECILANLERTRWKYRQQPGDKYVIANIPAYELYAVDQTNEQVLSMRICCGKVQTPTPLLSSKITYMELNPYWNVPKSIVWREIIPTYQQDTTYFTRNRMVVLDKKGKALNPHRIKWSKFKKADEVPYRVRQENREGNSLGRIIFRFPNEHSVYLHDTPSKWIFQRDKRAVSHGCVRLEKPLDFAFFLLKEPDDLLQDRIRLAMDLPPETSQGEQLLSSNSYKELKHYSLPQYIPLYIDYRTIYKDATGKLTFYKDVYNYDRPLLEEMRRLDMEP